MLCEYVLNMNRIFLLFCIVITLPITNMRAQMVGADIFLKGDYVEVGIASNGSFGTYGNAPTGYHARPDFGIIGGPLGFVADPALDGWGVAAPGFPDYFGDYFYPGTPQEGWDVEVAGSRGEAWRGTGPTSFTGSLSGVNTAYTSAGGQAVGVWQGSMGNLTIKQTTTQKKDKVYFVVRVELTNVGSTTLNNIYYNRSLDPEPDACVASNYSSDKKIIYQPNGISKNCLVIATGQDYHDAYVGLGSKDCRAKCYITNTYTPDAALSNVFNQNGAAASYLYNVAATSSDNTSMGVVFNVGSLGPGESTELAYAYILKQADLDSALAETAPSFESGTVSYKPYSTFRVCPGKTIPLKIKGGTAYKWVWTPGNDLDADSLISSAALPPAGGAYGDSVSITVNGPRTYTARGYSNCDTQQLIFYVDTISFSVPPSVTTPVQYCQKASASPLTASGASGATIYWSTSMGGPETTAAPTPNTTTAGTTRYYVRQQNAAGCYSQYAFIDVIIIGKPEPPVVRDTVYCYGAKSVPVTAVGTAISWYSAATGGTKYGVAPTPSTTGTSSSFYPSQTVDGCVSDRATLKVDIAKVKAAFTLAKDSLCGPELLTTNNKSTHTLAGVDAPFNSLWAFGDGNVSSALNPSNSYSKLGIYTIKLIVSDNTICSDSIEKQVFVAPSVVLSFIKSDSLICQGQAIDFIATATPGYYKLIWDFGDGDALSYDELSVHQAFTSGGSYNINFKAFYTICGEVETTQTINVTQVPKVNIGEDSTICPGNSVLLLKNYAASANPLSYMWNTGDTTSQIGIRNEGNYWLRVKDRNCVASDSIKISKGCYIDIPNAFVPGDNDPYNAYFLPRSLLAASVATFEMKIYNRWGELIFESNEVNGRGWDGKFKGQDEPMGVYVYQIQVSFANGLTENYNGNVTLVR